MIKEVVIVEGKADAAALLRACDADYIITSGLGLNEEIIARIEKAYSVRGIVILTDPDHAGEVIRRKLSERFPDAKQAFIARSDAKSENDIGIENAKPEAIISALDTARVLRKTQNSDFKKEDLMKASLQGTHNARERREILGKKLGLGYCNAKTLLVRLNSFDITREEWEKALAELDSEDAELES